MTAVDTGRELLSLESEFFRGQPSSESTFTYTKEATRGTLLVNESVQHFFLCSQRKE